MFANGNLILGTGVVDNGYKLEVTGTLALRASASASAATQVPVFIADPSGTTRELVTRTPAQLLGDAGAIAGTLAIGQVAFGTAANTIGGDSGLTWDNTNKRLTVGTPPSFAWLGSQLEVRNQIRIYDPSSSSFGLRFGFNSNIPFIQGFRETVGAVNLQLQPSGGNLLVGTTTDAGFRLDVNGSTRFNGLSTIQGTTASDSGQLGAELLTTGTGDASWTGTSFATGYTHVVGSTTTLTSTLAGVVNTFYQITYTVTGRTAGSFIIDFGGATTSSITATGAVGPRATTTGTLVITPTSDFNGTIVLSIRSIAASSASVTFNSSAGTTTSQIRISSLATNTFIGINSGTRNTTGIQNSFYGQAAGDANTTGANNSFFGRASGNANTLGGSNSFFGSSSGLVNTTGSSNSFFGVSSGVSNTIGGGNSFFGTTAGQANTTGNDNSFFGQNSGFANTTGINNTFIGRISGFNISSGSQNTFIGTEAGRYTGSGTTAMTSIDNSIYLGFRTRGLNATGSTNELVIGYNVVGLGSNTTVLGNTFTTFGRWYGSLLLGTTTNAASSILTMESTTQGFLPPRMTQAQRTAIASPAEGLIVYQTNSVIGLYIYANATWRTLGMI
jgi:hypothetical protein